MDVLATIGFWSGILLCLPAAFLLLEVACSRIRLRPSPVAARTPGTVILVPAHNEGAGIERTLERLLAIHDGAARIVVIADNCSDDTAARARSSGVEVWERRQEVLRGKPYALAWALERLSAEPPEVVVFLDADCWFRSGSPVLLAGAAAASGRPTQCVYLMEGKGLGPFAFRVRNEARLRGLQVLGSPVQITGSGFAVPWDLLLRVPVPLGELAEDAIWGWSFCRAGSGALLVHEVIVCSVLPYEQADASVQRRRWEHGILSAALRSLPALLRSALMPPRPRRILHLFDILIPPLALLVLLLLGALALAAAGGRIGPLVPAAAGLVAVAGAVLIAWLSFGRAYLPLSSLLTLPIYVVKKIGLYLAFLFRRERQWIRTRRDPKDRDGRKS